MDDGSRAPEMTDLVEQHYSLLYRIAYRLTGSVADAEDLTQQAFLTAQRKLHQLREPSNARAWLCTIVKNAFFKSCRTRHDEVVSLERVAEPTLSSPEEVFVDREELQHLLDELPEEFRVPLVLFYFGELTYKDIAEQMDVPMGTIMSRLARGKAHLRNRLTQTEVAGQRRPVSTAAAANL